MRIYWGVLVGPYQPGSPMVWLSCLSYDVEKLSSDRGGQGGQKIHEIGWLVLMKFHEKNTRTIKRYRTHSRTGTYLIYCGYTHLLSRMQTAVFVASDLCISPSLASRMPLEIRPCTVRQLSVIQRCWDPSARFVMLCLWFCRYVLLCSQLFE